MKFPFSLRKPTPPAIDHAAVLAEEVAQLRAQLTPAGIITRLAEYDPRLLSLLMDQMNRDTLIGGHTFLASARNQSVQLMRYAAGPGGSDVQTANAVKTWTSWGFGKELRIRAIDPAADAVWQACWTAARNRPLFGARQIHRLSEDLLIDGEVFFVAYASTLDGETTWRTLDTLAATEIVTAKNDPDINLYYVTTIGNQSVAIPDAFAHFALRDRFTQAELPRGVVDINTTAEMQQRQTFACIVPAQRNRDSDGRGWPEFSRALAWSNVYSQMLKEYSAVFSAVAMFVDKLKVQGGQTTVDSIVAALQSSLVTGTGGIDRNPRPVAGSTWVENGAADRERLPLGTAAGDMQAGTGVMASQLATAYGVKASDVGRPDLFQNLATAQVAAESPQQGWERYQTFWRDVWGDVVETTLRLRTEFGRQTFTDYTAEVSLSLPLDIATADIAAAMEAVNKSVATGTLTPLLAVRAQTALTALLLQDLGVKNVAELLEPPAPQEAQPALPAPLAETHVGVSVPHRCPLCGAGEALYYAGHGPLLVCAECGKTYNPDVE